MLGSTFIILHYEKHKIPVAKGIQADIQKYCHFEANFGNAHYSAHPDSISSRL
jgi:hypothetical protein